jgi:hypothetical protein
MTDERCQRYLADPEANQSHLETCDSCRSAFGTDVSVEALPLRLEELPLAPWEGSSHRSWPLVIVSIVVVLAAAATLFTIAGVSPLNGMTSAAESVLPSAGLLQFLGTRLSSALQHVPRSWQLVLFVAFFVVNAALFALMRRPAKGLDG